MSTPIPNGTKNVGNQLQLETNTGELYVNYGAEGTEKLVTNPELITGLNKKQDIDFNKIVEVGVGGDYYTLEDLFLNEPTGKTLIKLIDKNYYCINPKFLVKEGWIIKGEGLGKTKITFTFNSTIDPNLSGLQVRSTCRLEDFELVTVNNTNAGAFNQYALHTDYPSNSFFAKITRCSFKTILDPDQLDQNNFNGLCVGIGTWEGQIVEFDCCYLEGAYVTYSDKYTLNLHNTYISGNHSVPCRVSFYHSTLSGGFTTLLISDVYSNDAESNEDRIQDLFEFVSCNISSIWLRSHSQTGTVDKKNGIIYNFSGSKIQEFISTDNVVDTSLENYTIKSLPLTQDVTYLKNIGSTTISTGDFVSYVYEDRLPEYHLGSNQVINTIIGVEKLSSSNIKNFAGISLVNSGVNNFLHLLIGAIGYTSISSSTLNIGDNVTFNSSGALIKSDYGGIGAIRKKTYDNRLGIELTPHGIKTNIIGNNDTRGVVEIHANASTVGAPTVRLRDLNSTGYGYQITNGSNANSVSNPTELGRFSISDLVAGRERFSINKDGVCLVSGELSVLGTVNTNIPQNTAALKIQQNGVNKFEVGQDGSNFYFYDYTTSETVVKIGGSTLQVLGSAKASANDGNNDTLVRNQDLQTTNVVSSASTLTLTDGGYYTFNGTTATWTLPTLAGNAKKRFLIMNQGSGAIMVNTSGGANEIFNGSNTNSITVGAGEIAVLYNNSLSWFKQI